MSKRGISQRRRNGSYLREIREDLWDEEKFEEIDSKENFDNRRTRRNSGRHRRGQRSNKT